VTPEAPCHRNGCETILIQAGAGGSLAWILLDEALSVFQAAGGALILAGIFVARPRRMAS
jgi:drug/metabolite transporter (DMT)-like permease